MRRTDKAGEGLPKQVMAAFLYRHVQVLLDLIEIQGNVMDRVLSSAEKSPLTLKERKGNADIKRGAAGTPSIQIAFI